MFKLKDLVKNSLAALGGISAILSIKDWYKKQSELGMILRELKELTKASENNLENFKKLAENTKLSAEQQAALAKHYNLYEKKCKKYFA